MADKTRKPVSKSQPDNGEPKPSGLRERLERSGKKLPRETSEELSARIDATLSRLHAEANPPGRTSPSFVVRFPDDGMRERLAHIAKKNGRSANSEIIDRLQKSMIGDTIANLEEMVAWLAERVEKLERKVSDLTDR
jgi:Arc-like DNA binding domain